MLVYSKYEI